MHTPLRGLVAAPHTPFDAAGSLAVDRVEVQAQLLREDGVVGAFVGGTTGEWPSLSVAERRQLAERWLACGEGLTLIAHVGHACQRDSIELAAHAKSAGMHAVSALAPSYFRPQDVGQLVEFFAPIAAAAGELPFYVYHIPGLTGVNLPPEQQLAACLERLPNFAGIKFTDPDLHALGRCLAEFSGRCEILWGVDELLLPALSLGVQAAVGSTYNYAAPVYLRMIEAHGAGDLARARELSRHVTAMVDILLDVGVLAAGKRLMGVRGVDVGVPRPPVAPLSSEQEQQLLQRFAALQSPGQGATS